MAGAAAQGVPIDITDEASLIAAYDAGEASFGIVDTIVANAGVSIPGRSTDITAADLRTLTGTNFNGFFLLRMSVLAVQSQQAARPTVGSY